jgi:hypothetical protein
MTRDEARAAGSTIFDSGRPCRKGHEPVRYTANYSCVECARVSVAEYGKKHPDIVRQRRKDWLKRNPEKARQYERNKRLKNPEGLIARTRRAGWKFRNMPTPTRPEPTTCECCGNAQNRIQNGRPHGLHLDHDHATGVFRGWLCNACNLGIGKLGDTIESLEHALTYLRRAAAEASVGHTSHEDARRSGAGSSTNRQRSAGAISLLECVDHPVDQHLPARDLPSAPRCVYR